MMAHINTAGVHVPLWLDSNDPAIGWGVDRVNYPMQEGTFFGDIIDTGLADRLSKPGVTAPVAYYCDGAGFPAGANGIVAGRLGANQSGAPYSNPFGSGTLCQNAPTCAVGQFSQGVGGSCPSGSNTNPAAGCPDGYKALTTKQRRRLAARHHRLAQQQLHAGVRTSYIYRLAPLPANGASRSTFPTARPTTAPSSSSTRAGTARRRCSTWSPTAATGTSR